MLLIKIAIVSLLTLLFYQDIKTRMVSWPIFPGMAFLMFLERWLGGSSPIDLIVRAFITFGLLALQLTLITLYFSIRQREWVNITREMLGWGDILFLATLTIYLPLLSFFLFYIGSLFLVITGWLSWKQVDKSGSAKIPLAGLQALLLGLLSLGGCWLPVLDLTAAPWQQFTLI